MKKKPNPIILNPRLKVATLPVKFRDKNGRFCKPAKGASFEITPKGKKKPLKGAIPKDSRKSVTARKQYIAQQIVDWSTAREVKRAKTETKTLKKKLKAVKSKPVTKTEKKKQQRLGLKIAEAVATEVERPRGLAAIEKKRSVTYQSEKFLTSRTVHTDQKHKNSRTGIDRYQKTKFEIAKVKVAMEPTEVHYFNAKPSAVALREYFRPHAEKFFDQQRKQSDNAYIMRVMTQNKLEGHPSKAEGIGTERFIIRESLSNAQYRDLKAEYPGLTRDQILREEQLKDISDRLKDLFEYFLERYQDYLSKKVISSVAVTGFTMEVVKGVIG